MSNLLENGVRYSPAGGEIGLTLRDNGDSALISVSDRGIGIAADDLDRLFERYFRSDEAKRGSGDGMGIGLYITSKIVAAYGGRIWEDSVLGKGSTFYVELPLILDHALNETGDLESSS